MVRGMLRLSHYFNSRPSARGDGISTGSKRHRDISIHAPPRGATNAIGGGRRARNISIHAPPRGATARNRNVFRMQRNFNSRPSARGDSMQYNMSIRKIISIHAPPRGATGLAADMASFYNLISIHAPPRGATGAQKGQASQRGHFNSRPSARGDKKAADYGNKAINFNSRPSARGDDVQPPRRFPRQSYFNSRPSARGDRCR